MNKTYNTIRQPFAVTMMRPEKGIYTETDKKGNVIARQRTVNTIDMKLRYRALQSIQHVYEGIRISDETGQEHIFSEEELTARVDMSQITDKDHYKNVEHSANKMADIGFIVPDKDKSFYRINMLASTWRNKGSRYIEMKFTPDFVRCLASTWGWVSFYDADVICSLKSVSSMKMYELVARRDKTGKPIIVTYDELKDVLLQGAGYDNKYGPNDLDRYVLRKAKDELDEKSPYSFDFRREKDNDEWVYYIQPYHIARNEPKELKEQSLQRQISLGLQYPAAKKILLSSDFYAFTQAEIKNNHELLVSFSDKTGIGLASFLIDKYDVASTKENPKAWIVGTMKQLVKEHSAEKK